MLLRAVIVAVVAHGSSAFAHDYWVLPSEPVVPLAREIRVSLFLGQGFVSEVEKPFERARIARLAHVRAGGVDDLLASATEGSLPLLRLPLPEPGGHLVVVDRPAARIELAAKEFEEYLHHEGLEHIAEKRASAGEAKKSAREKYSRYLKTFVWVGPAEKLAPGGPRDEVFRASVGQTLELLPAVNPCFVAPGEALPIELRFKGQALSGVTVDALSRVGADVRRARHTTDAAGRIRLAVDRRALWLVRTVHMTRCERCADADWESFWTSYTFASADPSGAPVVVPRQRAGRDGAGAGSSVSK